MVFSRGREILPDRKRGESNENTIGSCTLNMCQSHRPEGHTPHIEAANSVKFKIKRFQEKTSDQHSRTKNDKNLSRETSGRSALKPETMDTFTPC